MRMSFRLLPIHEVSGAPITTVSGLPPLGKQEIGEGLGEDNLGQRAEPTRTVHLQPGNIRYVIGATLFGTIGAIAL